MKAILIQQGLEKSLLPDEKRPESVINNQKAEIQSKTYSAMTLSFSDNVLRMVSHVNTIHELREKLEEIYRSKALLK